MDGIRPIAFDSNADGSTRNMYVQLSDLHGFTVVDFATREEIARIELPEVPLDQREPEGTFNRAPAHGNKKERQKQLDVPALELRIHFAART